MTGEIEEYTAHRFRELFPVHIIELAIIGTRIDNNVIAVQDTSVLQ